MNELIAYLPNKEQKKIQKAVDFAYEAHDGQLRKSSEPYINHPLATAVILAELKLDSESIVASILHDTLEDTEVTSKELQKEFGQKVCSLVDGVTKVSNVRLKQTSTINKTEDEIKQLESLRKLFLAMAKDLRVVLIKLADRLHNMQTLQYVSEEKQSRIASETLEIYVPLANRLGIWPIKSQLEDLCFKYLFSQDYLQCLREVNKKTSKSKKYVDSTIKDLDKYLSKQNISKYSMSGRMKNLYSIYLKTIRKNLSIDEIYDIYAIRIIGKSLSDCYTILGHVHNFAKPIPGRFKDYIAVPKPNGYQSLHTSVFTKDGQKLEIQIRTQKMHDHAEYGVAAHWLYKEKNAQKEINWVKELSSLKDSNIQELSDELKIDLFNDRIFIYTPGGDIKDLPINSTSIDFAYSIHSEVGDKLVGAKVNGKIVPLDHKLSNRDIVEILTAKNSAGPKRQWLEIAQTNFAKNKIRSFLKKANYDENLKSGMNELNNELKKFSLPSIGEVDKQKIKNLLDIVPYKNIDDVAVAISQGDLSPKKITKMLFPTSEVLTTEKPRVKKSKSKSTTTHIVFGDNQKLSCKLASHCCSPVYPKPVIGYITRGRGVTVHELTCSSLTSKEPERLIIAKWSKTKNYKYYANLELSCEDRVGMLHDITKIVSEAKINLTDVSVRFNKSDSYAIIKITVNIDTLDKLSTLINKLSDLAGVKSVQKI